MLVIRKPVESGNGLPWMRLTSMIKAVILKIKEFTSINGSVFLSIWPMCELYNFDFGICL